MSDPKFPPPSGVPDLPRLSVGRPAELEDFSTPTAADLVREIADLKAELAHVAGLFTTLGTRLSRHQLMLLESIHKADVAIALQRDLGERVGKIESKLGMAAE